MITLVLDTATPATVVGLADGDRVVVELRHDPGAGERPGHVAQVLELARRACDEAGLALAGVGRIGAGVGPGSFTGLRIGLATARALSQATGAELVPVSTLDALAAGSTESAALGLAVLDARRGEAFVCAYRDGRRLGPPEALGPDGLGRRAGDLGAGVLAVGDGAIRFREALESAGARVPPDGAVEHRVGAAGLARVAAVTAPVPRDALRPDYVREPDAVPSAAR